MITSISIIKLIFLMVIIPFVLGFFLDGFFSKSESGEISEKFMISRCFVLGFCAEIAVFQLVAVPFIVKRAAFHNVKYTFVIALAIVTILSVLFSVKGIKKRVINKINEINKMNTNVFIWGIVILLIVFETQLLALNMHMDTDDARFIAEALEACEKDTMLQLNCITGEHYDTFIGELRKEVAAPYPFFIATISSLTNIHPATLAHTCFPVFLIPLFYMCMYMLGRFYFSDSTNRVALYMLILNVIVLFSFESRFSWGYTLLTIIWQGRSIACLILLPALFYVLSNICIHDKINIGMCFSELVLMFACANLSGMAAMMAAAVSGIFCVSAIVRNLFIKDKGYTVINAILKSVAMLICTIPAYVYISLLFLMGM